MAAEPNTLTCEICPRLCKLGEGETGFCNVRKNVNGESVDALYGFFYPYPEEYNQFAPGSYTIVFPGCNMKCWFCNTPFVSRDFNGDVSRWPGGTYRKLAPCEFVEKVKANAGPARYGYKGGLLGFFGGEPLIHPEFIVEAGQLGHLAGCGSKVHTNGFVSEHIIEKVAGSVDMVSINVKGSCSRRLYERMGADPNAVLRSIKMAWETPHVDGQARNVKTTQLRVLVGPGLEPTGEEIAEFGRWLVEKTDPCINVMVEPMFRACDHFLDRRVEHDELIPGDSQDEAARRLWTTGLALFDCGLLDVWLSFTGFGAVHVPSRKLRPLG